MTTSTDRERTALLELMAQVGPQAPTLCEGWTTHDLAAHLVARERRPLSAVGIVVPPLHGLTAAAEQRMRQRPYEELLDTLRQGPPAWSPGGALPGPLHGLTDLHEVFVHHEDVRRLVDPSARDVDDELDRDLWRRVRVLGPALAARVGRVAIAVSTPDGRRAGVHGVPFSRTGVLLVGEPGELLLWLFGRRDAAHVEVRGTAAGREQVLTARLGL